MPTSNEFDWAGINAMLKAIAPKVLRNFPYHVSHDCDEIIQEVLLKLYRSGYSEYPSRKLLAVIVKHQAIDRIRSSRRVRRLEDVDVVDPTGERAATKERRTELWRLLKTGLAELPEEDRLLLMKFYRGKVKIMELADGAGVGYSAMAVRLFRIKEKLRQVINGLTD